MKLKTKKVATLSDVLRLIYKYEASPGVGFKPRIIQLDISSFESVSAEVESLIRLRTEVDATKGTMTIMGIPVVLHSQTLSINEDDK